jgi:hypothetical protein
MIEKPPYGGDSADTPDASNKNKLLGTFFRMLIPPHNNLKPLDIDIPFNWS